MNTKNRKKALVLMQRLAKNKHLSHLISVDLVEKSCLENRENKHINIEGEIK